MNSNAIMLAQCSQATTKGSHGFLTHSMVNLVVNDDYAGVMVDGSSSSFSNF